MFVGTFNVLEFLDANKSRTFYHSLTKMYVCDKCPSDKKHALSVYLSMKISTKHFKENAFCLVEVLYISFILRVSAEVRANKFRYTIKIEMINDFLKYTENREGPYAYLNIPEL